nr:hypothetical protein [Tanacetum cinerariifolium]
VDNDKATTETEAESMVSVTIQQDMSSIPPMTSPIIDLTSRPETPKRLDSHRARLYTLEQLDILHQVSKAVNEVVTDAIDWAMQAPLRNRFKDLPEVDMKEILHKRMWETDSYKSHEDHMHLYEALEKLMNRDHSEELANDMAKARPFGALGSFGTFGSYQVPPPPPPPPSTTQEGHSKGSAAPSSSKIAASAEYQAWMTTDIRLRMSISLTPADLQIGEEMAPDEQAQSSDDEDIGSAHIPKVNLWQDWWRHLEEEQPATPEPAWSIPSSDVPVLTNNWASALASNYSPPPEDSLLAKGSRPALSILKMKAAYYLDVGLEQMVPDQIWIEEECKYDIAAMYGIFHWWFQRQRFYIDRHTSKGDRSIVRTHMRILSVVRIKVFSMYGSPKPLPPKDKKILTTTDNQWTRHLVIRQRVEDFQLGIESYQTQLNLTKPRWDATGFKYKHDYTVIDSPRAVMFQDRYEVQMIMRFNETHKFRDGTLQQIDEALDYRVKEFKINGLNPGLNMRFWTRKDVDRSKAFMFAIQKRLKTRRIFRNL